MWGAALVWLVLTAPSTGHAPMVSDAFASLTSPVLVSAPLALDAAVLRGGVSLPSSSRSSSLLSSTVLAGTSSITSSLASRWSDQCPDTHRDACTALDVEVIAPVADAIVTGAAVAAFAAGATLALMVGRR